MGKALRRFVRWMRVIHLPNVYMWIILASFVAIDTGLRIQEWWSESDSTSDNSHVRVLLLIPIAVAYGFFRLLVFHPMCRPSYAKWLLMTPWTSAKRLPEGPAFFVWQDVLVVGALTALAFLYGGISPLWIPFIVIICYALPLCTHLLSISERYYAYALILSLSCLVRAYHSSLAVLLLVVLILVVSALAVRRTIRHLAEYDLDSRRGSSERLLRINHKSCTGWPNEYLTASQECVSISFLEALVVSAMFAWLVYVLLWILCVNNFRHFVEEPTRELLLIYRIVLWFVVLSVTACRVLRYCIGYGSPISLWGRIRTGRWVILGHDIVFVAPLIALAVAWIFPFALGVFQVPLHVSHSLTVFVSMAILLCSGPTLRNWRLTGQHRIQPTGFDRRRFEKI